jgi:alpha-L-arabinofuranosidase
MNRTAGFGCSMRRLMIGTLCLAASLSAQSTLSLNVGQATYTINRELYGGLLEQTSTDVYRGLYTGTASSVPNTNGMRNDVMAAFRESGVATLDWPGGCEAETYNWRNGIGPKAGRTNGDMANGMGTNEYFQLCDSVGSIPYVTADIRSPTQTPAVMTAWLNYIDSLFPNKLKYWKMGNEPWGGCTGLGVSALSVTDYINIYNQYKAAIPAKLAGKVARIIDGGSGDYLGKPNWIDSIMRCEMNSMEGATFHYYGMFAGSSNTESYVFTSADYYNRLSSQWALEAKVRAQDSIMTRYDPNYTVGLMVDEWGSWYSQTVASGKQYTQSTCRDAVIASINLNTFNNHCRRVKMACVAQPVNFIQPLVLTEYPAQSRIVKTPTLYVYKMYRVHQKAKMVPATWSANPTNQNVPITTASASVDSTGKLHISMCNTDYAATHTVAITLNNAPSYASCTGTIVNGPAANSYNDFGAAEAVNIQSFAASNFTFSGNTVNVTMPAHSVVTIELKPAVGVIRNSLFGTKSRFTVTACAGGKIVLRYAVTESTPFTLGLYSIDGRTIAATCKGILVPGGTRFVWQPKNTGRATNACIVKTSVGERSESQRIVF